MLEISPLNPERYLPPPRDEFSAVAGVTGSHSGSSRRSDRYDFRADALFAYGTRHLRVEGGVLTGGRGRLDQLSAVINWPDYEAVGGLFRTRPLRAIGDREVAGVRFGVSHKTLTRLSLERLFASPIQIFLPRRSQVELRRTDGRLLSTGIYDAGTREIDTSPLPEGAYDVQVLIVDRVSGNRVETRLFAKSAQLPPRGKPLYFAEAGALRADRRLGDELDFEGGYGHLGGAIRHTDRIGYDADLAWLGEDMVFGLGTFLMERGINLRAGQRI